MMRTPRRVQDEPPSRCREERDPPGWARLWPLATLTAVLVLAWAFGLFRYVSFDALAEHRGALALAAGPARFGGAALPRGLHGRRRASIPAGPVLTMAGGLLFGRWLGAGLAFPAATAGACVLFLVVRSSLAPAVARRAAPFMERRTPPPSTSPG